MNEKQKKKCDRQNPFKNEQNEIKIDEFMLIRMDERA